jgi:hypothetical protein
LGSWSGGLIHDWSHSYNPLIAFALINVVLGLIPSWSCRRCDGDDSSNRPQPVQKR